MQAAGIDAFIGNTSEELAMANLASLPTVVGSVTPEVLVQRPQTPTVSKPPWLPC